MYDGVKQPIGLIPQVTRRTPDRRRPILEDWMRSYRPEELFDEHGAPDALVLSINPVGELRMSGNPHANGGLLTVDLDLPDFREYAVPVEAPGRDRLESTRKLGEFMRSSTRARPRPRSTWWCATGHPGTT
nr:hypothetical protein [Nonomuraea terrae]